MKIEKCVCGRKAFLSHKDPWLVRCDRAPAEGLEYSRSLYPCWQGPERKTKSGAIKAWNRLMTAYDRGFDDGYATGHEDQMQMRIRDEMERKK